MAQSGSVVYETVYIQYDMVLRGFRGQWKVNNVLFLVT
jgi:hypothetical protein